MSIDEVLGGNIFENLCYIESHEEPRRGATGMSPDELSSCLPATPIFSYRVTATLSIRLGSIFHLQSQSLYSVKLLKDRLKGSHLNKTNEDISKVDGDGTMKLIQEIGFVADHLRRTSAIHRQRTKQRLHTD
uniref:Uncharacterized protein n=1 Tax=Vespula pensylvanica TaxID=30213 RepID=A0A834KCK6_VESPE|nr:hypothetical protein H0235_014942 [Vespula pensylvanica]